MKSKPQNPNRIEISNLNGKRIPLDNTRHWLENYPSPNNHRNHQEQHRLPDDLTPDYPQHVSNRFYGLFYQRRRRGQNRPQNPALFNGVPNGDIPIAHALDNNVPNIQLPIGLPQNDHLENHHISNEVPLDSHLPNSHTQNGQYRNGLSNNNHLIVNNNIVN